MATRKKTGGRQKGVLNKDTKVSRDILRKEIKAGETPLEYMMRVMRDETVEKPRRDEMAKSAAPYMHAKLQSTLAHVTGTIENKGQFDASALEPDDRRELYRLLAQMSAGKDGVK